MAAVSNRRCFFSKTMSSSAAEYSHPHSPWAQCAQFHQEVPWLGQYHGGVTNKVLQAAVVDVELQGAVVENSALTGLLALQDDRLRDSMVVANDGSAVLASFIAAAESLTAFRL